MSRRLALAFALWAPALAWAAATDTPRAPAPSPPTAASSTHDVAAEPGIPFSAPSTAQPPAATSSPPPAAVPSKTISALDYKKFRDPFKEPAISESTVIRSDLEKFPVTDFKVTGVITGPIRMRAMVLAPDGKTHYVTDGMKMGTRDGVIVRITTKTVVVREKVVNPLGEVEQFDTEIGIDQQAGANAPGH